MWKENHLFSSNRAAKSEIDLAQSTSDHFISFIRVPTLRVGAARGVCKS